MTAIRLEDVTKKFEGVRSTTDQESGHLDDTVFALDHVDLSVVHGQTMAVIGPSGCGKSTLLRVVAGLDKDYTGHVFYDNQDMRNIPPRDRHIGMVFQNYALYPHFESRENLAFYFRLRRAPDKETEKKIRITSEMMGIGFKKLLRHKPGVLSGGEQQRIAIARAIVRTPRIFLFDEPLSNLDAKLRVKTRGEMKRLLKRFNITSIYVTHDQIEAIAFADRIAVMREGRIEQVGTYGWLRSDPKNMFVAGFVGTPPMNLFNGMVSDGRLFLGQVSAPLPDRIKAHVRSGRRVTLGVRPEEAQLVTDNQRLPEGLRLRGMVDAIEPDFAHSSQLLHLRTGGFPYIIIVTMDTPLRLGDAVEIIFPMDKFFFFDSDTDERIR
jgi:ABC-type sugar transport system ATPase subunit